MPTVVTLGEAMVVFTSEEYIPLEYATSFKKGLGGAEANFAIGVRRLGVDVGWISRIGKDPFGNFIIKNLKSEGVDVSGVKIDEDHPTGIYFKEKRNSIIANVYYYRKGSAASFMVPEDLDEGYIASAKILHITGITPALSDTCRATVYKAIEIAKSHNITISFDPNIRLKLWKDNEYKRVLLDIAQYADIVLPGLEEGKMLFGITEPESIAKKFLDMGAKIVALKLGNKGAMLVTQEQTIYQLSSKVKEVDPVGAGDGFDAGFIVGLLRGWELKECLRLANDVGAIVVSTKGDMEGLPTMEEVEIFRGNMVHIER